MKLSSRARIAQLILLVCFVAWPASKTWAQLPASVLSADGSSATAPHLKVSLVSSAAAIAPGAGFQTGIHFELDKGWHVYWLNAGDVGEPPTVKWTLPADITAGPLQFPAPHRIPYGPLLDYGYPDEVLFPVDMEVAPALKTGAPAVLSAKVDWLVCERSCIPGKATLKTAVMTSSTPASSPAGLALIQKWNNRLPKPLPPGAATAFSMDPKEILLSVRTAHRGDDPAFFPSTAGIIDSPAPQVVSTAEKGVALQLKRSADLKANPAQLDGVLTYADGSAYEIHARPGKSVVAAAAAVTPFSSSALLRALGLALVGGIILNLMPCVFPVLFIKALSLVQSSQTERRHMRLHGLVYTLGILVSFWAVVAVLLALRAGGQQLGWGFQFQSPEFLAVMALLLFFLGLSLAGMFEIGLSLTSAGGSLAQKHGYAGSFFTGVLAMVVATPCTAPFMGVAIGYALAQPSWVSFLVFTALGLGLAIPYLLLAFQPAWTRILPRPGAWMEILKQATAVPIFATVIWIVWLFTASTGANELASLLLAFLLLGVAGWILGRWPARRLPTTAAVLVIVAAVAVPLFAVTSKTHVDAKVDLGPKHEGANPKDWQPFTPDIVTKYQAQGRPVLVDFTANWCLSCQVNERVVLDRPEVEKHLQDSGIALVRADWTHHDDDIAKTLSQLGRSGVPAYALYPADAGQQPILLPEVLTTGILYDAVDKIAPPKVSSLVPTSPVLER
jgi:thiol:disulfide interchange protein